VNLDEQQHFELFVSIPSVINVKNEEGIMAKLKKLISSKNELEKINLVIGKYPKMKLTTRNYLINYFKPHTEKLYKILGESFEWKK